MMLSAKSYIFIYVLINSYTVKQRKAVETEEFTGNSGALRRRQESVNPTEQLCCRELARSCREDFHPINLELCISFPRLSLNPGVGTGLRATTLEMLYIRSGKLTFPLLFVRGDVRKSNKDNLRNREKKAQLIRFI